MHSSSIATVQAKAVLFVYRHLLVSKHVHVHGKAAINPLYVACASLRSNESLYIPRAVLNLSMFISVTRLARLRYVLTSPPLPLPSGWRQLLWDVSRGQFGKPTGCIPASREP